MEAGMEDSVIQTDGLTKRYGHVLAVDGLSLNVPRGRIFGLLGPNGSGKTTLMSMLLGLVRPTAGSFMLFGQSPERGGLDQQLHRIGALIETPTFYPYLSGRNNLAYFQGISGRGDPLELDSLLEQVGLGSRGGDKFQTYSLGMKQRLGLAYTLLGDPELLLLDEPTNGMDPAGMAEVRELIRGMGGENRTVILSSHLLNEVEQVCDSVAILSHGGLIAQGDVSELLQERGQAQVRLRTTDNAKATDILTALAWVESVSADNGYLIAGVAPDRSWEITAALSRNEGLRRGNGARADVAGAVLPRRHRGGGVMAMAMQVALLTRWEWFKLRRRWVPWILLGLAVALSQLVFWLAVTFGDDLSYQSTTENIANGLGVAGFMGPLMAVILTAAVVGGEYGWGTLRPVLSKGAGRWPFLMSKVSVALLCTAAGLLILAVLVAVSGFIAEAVLTDPESEGYGSISWVDLLALYGRSVYAFLPYIALALFAVVLTGSNGIGSGIALSYYFIELAILTPILGIFSWSGHVFAFLLGPNVGAWIFLDPTDERNIATFGGIPDMAHGFILVTAYVVVLAAAASVLFLRRDIAGAKGG